jgi:hypothetical protein
LREDEALRWSPEPGESLRIDQDDIDRLYKRYRRADGQISKHNR